MKVKVIREFYDKENDLQLRKEDEIFEAEDKRAKQLISGGFVMKAPETRKVEKTPKKENEAAK